MRGRIVQRAKKKGTWSIVLELDKDVATGKHRQQWITVQGSRRDAEKRLAELLHQKDTGTFIKPDNTTFADYLKTWLSDYAKPNLPPRTIEGYEYILTKHLIPALGNLPLAQLKPEHLGKYYSEKQRFGLSAQTVRHHHTVIHKALKTAMEGELLNHNVADTVQCPRTQQTEIQTWNESEVSQFLETAKGSQYYPLFYIALFTGMRRSELLALRWCDIDFILSELHVSRSLHVLTGGQVILRAPKTKTGKRTIVLPPSAFMVLTEYRKQREAEALLLGKPISDDSLVFSTPPDYKPFLPNTVTHFWNKIIRRIGIKHIQLHDARHTHASLMLKQGDPPKGCPEKTRPFQHTDNTRHI